MTKRSHTAGPWHRDGHNLSQIIRCVRERGHPDAKHTCGDWQIIATIHGDNWQADSQLIAAATDLLDAVYAALPFVEDALNDPAYKAGAVARHLKQMQAAIAKAEGATPFAEQPTISNEGQE